MNFLTAEWRKLAFANYAVDPGLLRPCVPAGTELDAWQDITYVSLIGFMFLRTRLLGIPVPLHRNFEEVNLRFYVRRNVQGKWRRGVVFIKEIVPKPAITLVANVVYGEAYETRSMRHQWTETADSREVCYQWKISDRWQSFGVTADRKPVPIAAGSETEYITEHYWGYAGVAGKPTNEYEVTHPRWEHYPVRSHQIDVDFAVNYGPDFALLNHLRPNSVFLAEGSEIAIKGKRKIR